MKQFFPDRQQQAAAAEPAITTDLLANLVLPSVGTLSSINLHHKMKTSGTRVISAKEIAGMTSDFKSSNRSSQVIAYCLVSFGEMP
jgi:hypothetical protein